MKHRWMGLWVAVLWLAGGLTAPAGAAAAKPKPNAKHPPRLIKGPDYVLKGRRLEPASFFIPQRIEFDLSWTAHEAQRDDDFLRRVLTPRWVDSL